MINFDHIQDETSSGEPVRKDLELLRRHFPGCFTGDGKFNLERFRVELSDAVPVTREGYGLNFLGRSYAKLLASTKTETVVVPDRAHNELPENRESGNLYISGNNLDALKHLAGSYAGRVKCIYIDPPYNTGSDGFVYNDKFAFTKEELSRRLNIDDERAEKLLGFTSKGSSSHSAWLT